MLRLRMPSLAVALALGALVPAGVASAAKARPTVDRGVVQSASPAQIVLRELDGRTVSLAVGAGTHVLVNGLPTTLADVRPGFVAAVTHDGPQPAALVRAFGRLARVLDRGTITSVSGDTLVLRLPAGGSLTLRLLPRTRVRLRGVLAGADVLRAGETVVTEHTPGGLALRILVVGAGRRHG